MLADAWEWLIGFESIPRILLLIWILFIGIALYHNTHRGE